MTSVSMLNPLNSYSRTQKTDSTEKKPPLNQGSVGSEADPRSLSLTDFYKLLAVQMQYQDADNPMDTGEMMNQLVQTQMSQAISYMTTAVSDLSTVNLITYASSMIGKEITVVKVDDDGKLTDETVKGVVTGVSLDGAPYVYVNGEKYSLSQIMSMGEVPEEPETPDNPEEPDNSGDKK